MSTPAPTPATSTPDVTGEISKALDGISTKLENVVTKDQVKGLQDEINVLKQDVKDLRVGDPNLLKDRTYGYKHFGELAQAAMRLAESNGTIADEKTKAAMSKSTSSTPFALPIPPAYALPLKSFSKAAGDGVTQSGDPFAVGLMFHPQYQSGLGSSAPQSDDLLDLIRIVPIDAGAESVTLDYVDDLTRASGLVRGGLQALWKAELDTMTEKKPKLRTIKLEPQELYAFAYASDKSLRNAPIALGAFLQDGMRDAVRFAVGNAIVNGDGAGKPRGLLNSPDKIQCTKTSSQLAASFNEDNIAKMWKRMPAAWRNAAVWLMNQDVEDQLDLMSRMGVGTTAIANQTGVPNSDRLFNADRMTIKTRPIRFCEYCATLGTAGDVILWAPQHYLVAVKTGQGPEMSMHLKFDIAQTAFRYITEVDGRSEFPDVLTPFKGSTTRSAIITMETR